MTPCHGRKNPGPKRGNPQPPGPQSPIFFKKSPLPPGSFSRAPRGSHCGPSGFPSRGGGGRLLESSKPLGGGADLGGKKGAPEARRWFFRGEAPPFFPEPPSDIGPRGPPSGGAPPAAKGPRHAGTRSPVVPPRRPPEPRGGGASMEARSPGEGPVRATPRARNHQFPLGPLPGRFVLAVDRPPFPWMGGVSPPGPGPLWDGDFRPIAQRLGPSARVPPLSARRGVEWRGRAISGWNKTPDPIIFTFFFSFLSPTSFFKFSSEMEKKFLFIFFCLKSPMGMIVPRAPFLWRNKGSSPKSIPNGWWNSGGSIRGGGGWCKMGAPLGFRFPGFTNSFDSGPLLALCRQKPREKVSRVTLF